MMYAALTSCQAGLFGRLAKVVPIRSLCHHLDSHFARPGCSAACSGIAVGHAAGILNRDWILSKPDAQVRQIWPGGAAEGSLLMIQDDLLHPVMGGNKLRKLDAVIPALLARGTTDVVTCGGLQSAHTAAVAAGCAEHGMKAHILVRGEHPVVPTGYHLLARMFGHVTYISRNEYADRGAMFKRYLSDLEERQGGDSTMKVHVLREGGAEPLALLGFIRLVSFLASSGWLSRDETSTIVIDSGTGVTATGVAIGVALLELPCQVLGVMLAGSAEYYTQQAADLASALEEEGFVTEGSLTNELPLTWVERKQPRKFGKVFEDDIQTCVKVARCHGILLDPIYSLAAWEAAVDLVANTTSQKSRTLMLHTGGSLGLHGVAQRFPGAF